MEESISDLADALALEPREHLSLVGGGGKTTLMFSLAHELRQKGKQVITSTTTKIWHHEALSSDCIVFTRSDEAWRHTLRERLRIHGHLFVAQGLLDSGKVKGISPSLADELYREKRIDYLLVEADGSAGHPVKAPDEHEPVIPSSVTKVVALLGLEAVGEKFGSEIVFRVDRFRKLTGLTPGQKLTPSILAKLFLDPRGVFKGTPLSAKRVAFLNKLDLLVEEQEARDLADLIMGNTAKQVDRVVIGSVTKGIYIIPEGNNERYLREDR